LRPVIKTHKIYEDLKNNKLDKSQASELLISIIENIHDNDDKSRILALRYIGLISPKSEKVFKFLENLLISDLNEQIRCQAAKIMIYNYPEKSIEPFSWAMKYDNESPCLVQIIRLLEKTSNFNLKSLLNNIKFVDFEDNIYFPLKDYPIINLNNKNIDNIKNIKNLENLTNLKKLYLNYNQITDINGLDTLTNLKSLHLQGNRIKEIKGLSHLEKLEFLYLNNNEISKIEGLDCIPNLKYLFLYDNKISEIRNLENLSNLEVLNLRNNYVSEIKGLEKLSNLRKLDLSNNHISDIKGIKNIINLQFLDLSHNEIREIKWLKNLKNLKFLDLRNNRITKITHHQKLKKVQHMYLGFNLLKKSEISDKFGHNKVLDIKNLDGKGLTSSLELKNFTIYDTDKPINKLELIKDIKFIPTSFVSNSIIKNLSTANDTIDFFTKSSWMILLKNNEYEIFRLSKQGNYEWIQKSRKLRNK
jgi:Leucine-rich repeat (LRR) protein